MSVSKIIQNNNGVAPQQVEGTLHFDRLNDFNLSFDHGTSFDFSKVIPVGHERMVAKDVFDLSTSINLLGNATPNPILSNIRQIVDTYRVPFQALYKDWEDVIGVYQSKGDQCPVDVRSYFNPTSLWNSLYSSDGLSKFDDIDVMTFCRYIIMLASIYGRDSILNNFNIHISRGLCCVNADLGIDDAAPSSVFFDIISYIYQYLKDNNLDVTFVFGNKEIVYGFNEYNGYLLSSVNQFIELIFSSSYAHANTNASSAEDTIKISELDVNVYQNIESIFDSLSWDGYNKDINIEPLIAYQMILSDKFSNAKVDNVYTARMFSDALRQIVRNITSVNPNYSFSLNGKDYYYEPYSAIYLMAVAPALFRYVNDEHVSIVCNYFLSIFGYGRPLRYGDYYTGARLEPLSPGNTRVTVENGEVDAVAINKKEWLYSFLYNLHLSTSEFKDYIRGIFGTNIQPSRSDIIRLVRKEKYLGKESVENTGSAQFEYVGTGRLPMSSILRGGASDASLMYHSKEPALLITLVWHDAKIFRSNTVAKDSQIKTVLDEYIPELEFIGDQQILGMELDGSRANSDVFGWNQRYAEYKMKTSFVSGAFLDDYANGMLLTDSGYSANNGPLELSSTFIRQSIQDYERFFGNARFGLQSVHAYAIVNFGTSAKRPMYVNPQPMR